MVRAVVLACLEPDRLGPCLRALGLWLPPDRITVLDNASTRVDVARIEAVASALGIPTRRPHRHVDRRNTLPYAHEALLAECRAHPDDVILKVDEDVLFAADLGRIDPGPFQFFVPALTINNYTTRRYLEAFRPDLAARAAGHGWMWHFPHPTTGDRMAADLAAAIYSIDPARLAAHAAANPDREVVGAADYERKVLMPRLPWGPGYQGISSTAIAFRARDYLSLFDGRPGVEEVLIGEAVHRGDAEYLVDHGCFGHHVNYYTVRDLVRANPDAVSAYTDRVLAVLTVVAESGPGGLADLPAWTPLPFTTGPRPPEPRRPWWRRGIPAPVRGAAWAARDAARARRVRRSGSRVSPAPPTAEAGAPPRPSPDGSPRPG